MKMILLATSFLAVSLTMPALVHAHDPKAHATASDAQISEGAKPAIDVVQQFSAVLKAADFQRACDLLAEDVLILESGGAERSREEYMSGHAIQDALFLKNAHSEIKHRTALVEGSFAWIGTESELHAINDGKPLMLLSTETNTAEKFRCWLVDRAYSLVIATEEGSATSYVFAWGGHSRPRLIS